MEPAPMLNANRLGLTPVCVSSGRMIPAVVIPATVEDTGNYTQHCCNEPRKYEWVDCIVQCKMHHHLTNLHQLQLPL